ARRGRPRQPQGRAGVHAVEAGGAARKGAMIARMPDRRYRAGDSVEDVCRACKLDRMHTVVVADQNGRPLRVSCGYCGSEHNYRGGPAATGRGTAETTSKPHSGPDKSPFPVVSDRERTAPPMTLDS